MSEGEKGGKAGRLSEREGERQPDFVKSFTKSLFGALRPHFMSRMCLKAACCMNFCAAGVFVCPASVSKWIVFGTVRAL